MLAIGIDPGTAHSVVATLRRGEPEVLLSHERSPLTPSILAAGPEGRLLAGHAADECWDGATVAPLRAFLPGAALTTPVPFAGREYTPVELLALLLARLREDAEAALGAPVRRAVLAAPVAFQQEQLAALRAAAACAGLFPLQIIPSTTAGLLAYSLAHPQAPPQTVMALDFGAGCLDVAVVRLFHGAITTLGQAGENWLGGQDLTEVIAASLLRRLQGERALLLDETRAARSRLRERLHRLAERAKLALSTVERVTIPLTPETTGLPVALEEEFTRERFEELIRARLGEVLATAERALVAAGLARESVDGILLMGGSSQVPALEAALARRLPGARLLRDLNPFLAVAMGAAALTGMLAQVTCPACGHRNPVGAPACRRCRASLEAEERVQCPSCWLPNDARRRACRRCGVSLPGAARAGAPARPAGRPCPRCGARLPWGRASCPACHAALPMVHASGLRCHRCAGALPAGTPSCPTCGEPVAVFLGRIAGRSLGIEREDGGLDAVLLRGHGIPSPRPVYRELRTAGASQRELELTIYEGDRPRARDNPAAARLCLALPEGLPAGSAVRVGFALDASGLLAVTATLADGSGQEVEVRLG